MKKDLFTNMLVRAGAVFLIAGLLVGPADAQNPFEEAIEQFTSDNVKGYIQPLIDSFGANINSGFPGSAKIGRMGLTFRFDIVAMGTFIGDSEKTFMATPPSPFPQEPVQTATVFGDEGAVVTHPGGVSYQFQNGQVNTSIVPFAVPQITVGDVYGTQMTLRYVPVPSIGDFPKVTLFGIGARHNVSQYLPMVPLDLAAGLFYQSLTIGDIINTKATALSAQASKTFAILTLYGGLQYETANVDLSYTYTGPLPPGDVSDRDVSLSLKGDNRFRARLGFSLALSILHLHSDINIGKVTVISAGIGFGI
jgi:hypothetical protein